MPPLHSDPEFNWPHPTSVRRLIQSQCECEHDFVWESVIGHGQSKFRGCQDLTMAVTQFAKSVERQPLLLLSDKIDYMLEVRKTVRSYIAIVNIRNFLSFADEHDKAASFLLSAFSQQMAGPLMFNGSISATVMKALAQELEVEGGIETLAKSLERGGSKLTIALLAAAVKGLERASPTDLEQLATLFARSSADTLAGAASSAKRRFALEAFEKLLDEDANEHRFQPWFEANSWVLGSECVRVLGQRKIDVEHIADFITEAYDGHADIIELKRPRLAFWNTKLDHGNLVPHQDLVAAIVQAQMYQFELERQLDSISMRDRLKGVAIAKPASVLIYGRSHTWTEVELKAQRLLNAGFSSLRIITYDQVLRRARALMGGVFSNVSEGDASGI